MNDMKNANLIVDGGKRHAVQRTIDAEDRNGADGHARQKNQIHVSGTDQVGECDAQKRAEYGDGHGL